MTVTGASPLKTTKKPGVRGYYCLASTPHSVGTHHQKVENVEIKEFCVIGLKFLALGTEGEKKHDRIMKSTLIYLHFVEIKYTLNPKF